MTSRVELLTERTAPMATVPYFEAGDPGPLVASWAQVPEMLDVTAPFVGMVLGASAVPFRTKEIVILRTSALLGCRYCVDAHTTVAAESGLSDCQLSTLRSPWLGPDDWSDFNAEEAALLAWIDAVAASTAAPPDALAEAIRANFGDAALVEITMLIGATVMLNRYATSLKLPTSPDQLTRLKALGFAGWSPAPPSGTPVEPPGEPAVDQPAQTQPTQGLVAS